MKLIGSGSMVRTSLLALLTFGYTSFAASAEEAKQLTCTGMMIEPIAMFRLGCWQLQELRRCPHTGGGPAAELDDPRGAPNGSDERELPL
jgi:hypothetical protein